jgi:hypothetical protein
MSSPVDPYDACAAVIILPKGHSSLKMPYHSSRTTDLPTLQEYAPHNNGNFKDPGVSRFLFHTPRSRPISRISSLLFASII